MRNYDKFILAIFVIASIGAAFSIEIYSDHFGFGLDSINNSVEKWGQTGDFFGGILNPIFGFLSLLAILVTLRQTDKTLEQNQKSLSISEKELELTRNELKRSSDTLIEQTENQRLQDFERTFFELLRLYNELINGMDVSKNISLGNQSQRASTTGRKVFVELYAILKRRIEKSVNSVKDMDIDEIGNSEYLKFYQEYQALFGHYFRTLYNTLKFVDNSNISNKKFYIDLLRAQLSSHELLLIYYNSQSDMGNIKLLPLKKNIIY